MSKEQIKQALYNARLDFDCIGEDLQAEIDNLTDSELIRLYNDYCVAE